MGIKLRLMNWLSRSALSDVIKSSNVPNTVLIDFSSPNVAKPFHLGHFRATVTGNFIRNINEAAGHRVISINYLGDWGTQFDVLSYGLKKYGIEEQLEADPIRHLYEVYIRTSAEIGKSSPPAASDLTDWRGTTVDYDLWSRIRALTICHLQKTYARMNVQFTAYEYESESVESAYPLVQKLLNLDIAARDSDGAVSIPAGTYEGQTRRIVLLKSNNATLYLTRDIATAVARHQRYGFDRTHYVVENSQRTHFYQLQCILSDLGYSWANRSAAFDSSQVQPPCDLHIPFGRVQGVSTRQGKGLFLSDILDNARDSILERMQNSHTTRAFFPSGQCDANTADHLGVTVLIVEMLRKNRQKPISLTSFLGHSVVNDSISSLPQDSTDLSGLNLQYCHARLCSLQRKAADIGLVHPVTQNDPASWSQMNEDLILRLDTVMGNSVRSSADPSFVALFDHLSSFPATLQYAYTHYEASAIVQFATRLTSCVNTAWRELSVLNCTDVAEQLLRLSLFMVSRDVLSTCLRLLGIHPLCAI